MKTRKQVTITFGTSVHYFKSSVSETFEVDATFDFDTAKKKVVEDYYKVLETELTLNKKFEKMTLKEIKKFVERKNDKA